MPESLAALLGKARALDRRALGKLVSAVEDARPEAGAARRELDDLLGDAPYGPVVGITGPPGVGKSSLVASLYRELLPSGAERSVAVVAVDPSSEISGGSVLGDRTRLHVPAEENRLFFRSQANDLELGGLSPHTFHVTRVLARLFDLVVVETVGVGQAELDVCHLADLSMVLVGPESGDQIQMMKAGLMELPDLVVATKVDLGHGPGLMGQLRAVLGARDILGVSASSGAGVKELAARILAVERPDAARVQARESHFFRVWVRRHYGASGLRALASGLGHAGAYEDRLAAFPSAYRSWLCGSKSLNP